MKGDETHLEPQVPGQVRGTHPGRLDECLEPGCYLPAEQPMPTINDHGSIQQLVIADMVKREQVGIARYGTALQPHNGRDMLRDLYEELLDACTYIRGVMAERDNPQVGGRAGGPPGLIYAERAHWFRQGGGTPRHVPSETNEQVGGRAEGSPTDPGNGWVQCGNPAHWHSPMVPITGDCPPSETNQQVGGPVEGSPGS